MSNTCYNLALDNDNRGGDDAETLKLLQEAYEIYEKNPMKDKTIQSRTLRFTAKKYIDIGGFDKALQTASLANEVKPFFLFEAFLLNDKIL